MAVLWLSGAPAQALVITPNYSALSGVTGAGSIEATFNSVINQYEALYTNNVTVTVSLEVVAGSFLGENLTFFQDVTYSQFRSALITAGNNGNAIAATAAATLPNQTNAPIDSTSTLEVSLPNARALGFTGSSFNPPAGDTDSTLEISSSFPIQYARSDGMIGADSYDLTSVTEHELDEILGLGSALNGGESGLPNYVRPEDLYRFTQNSSTRSFTLSSSAAAFLSINGGASDLVQLGQDPSGDYGDFFSPGSTTEDEDAPCKATVQVAATCPGFVQSVGRNSIEPQIEAAIGWDPRFSTAASNTTWQVNCAAGTVTSSGVQTVSRSGFPEPGSSSAPDALGALLGTPTQLGTITPPPAAGDIIEITGTCQQDVTVTTSGLIITNREGPNGSVNDTAVEDGDVIQGQLELASAKNVVVSGLVLGNFSASFSFAATTDIATLFIHDGATAIVMHSAIANSPEFGALVRRGAQTTFFDDQFYFNGFNSGGTGLAVLTDAKVMLGADDGSLSVLIQGSGGNGLEVGTGSSAIVHSATLAQNAVSQLYLESASSARLTSSNVVVELTYEGQSCESTHGTVCGNAIEADGSSALRIENGATVNAIDTGGGTTATAIELRMGSAVLVQGSTIEGPSGPPTIEAADNSIIALAGGNTICSASCNSSTAGTAIEIDHVAALVQVTPSTYGYSTAAESIFGGGTVQLQSTVDLGLGLVSAQPSLAWTTGSNGISVAQNSSFRLQGGASITGALKLSQGSNGFFNVTQGGSNTVSAGVTCPFTAIPGAHVAGQTSVTPNVSVSSSFFNVSAGQCLPF